MLRSKAALPKQALEAGGARRLWNEFLSARRSFKRDPLGRTQTIPCCHFGIDALYLHKQLTLTSTL